MNQVAVSQPSADTNRDWNRRQGDTNPDSKQYSSQAGYQDSYQGRGDTKHTPVVMHEDVARFYGRLSKQGRHVLAHLLLNAPSLESSFRIVVSSLARLANCSKLSVIRNLPKGERVGLFKREIDQRGRRHGSIVTPYRERCETFLALYRQQYALLADTNQDWYHKADTNGDQYQPAAIGISSDDSLAALAANLSVPATRFFHELFRHAASSATVTLSVQQVFRAANTSETTARRSLKRGEEAGLFTRALHEQGPRFGTVFSFQQEECKRFASLLPVLPSDTGHDWYQQQSDTNGDWYQGRGDTNPEQYHNRPVTSRDQYHDTNGGGIAQNDGNQRQHTLPIGSTPSPDTSREWYQQPPLLDRQIKNLSILPPGIQEDSQEGRSALRLTGITPDEFQVLWPLLDAKGFGPDQVRQIVSHRLQDELTVRNLETSLYRAEYELEKGTFPPTKKGVCNYLFSTLKYKGTWRKPEGFETPEEQALREAEEAEAVRARLRILQENAREEDERQEQDEAFEAWLESLTAEDRSNVMAAASVRIATPAGERRWLRTYWHKNIYNEVA